MTELPFLEQHELLNMMIRFEQDVRYQEKATDKEPEMVMERGRLPILLSAPHGAVHCRKKELKYEDEFTVAMVRTAAYQTGAYAFYARRRSDTDPNWYTDAPYKSQLASIIRQFEIGFVLDFHGASAKRQFGIGIGTLNGQSCPGSKELILDVLEQHGFSERAEKRLERLDIDRTFAAVGAPEQETVTRFVWEKLQVPTVQLEFNASLRTVQEKSDSSYLIRHAGKPFIGQPEHIVRTMKAMCSLIGVLAKAI